LKEWFEVGSRNAEVGKKTALRTESAEIRQWVRKPSGFEEMVYSISDFKIPNSDLFPTFAFRLPHSINSVICFLTSDI
jgi:hypothetical protein